MWSGDLGGQATGPPCPIQGSLKASVRHSRPWVRNEPQPHLAGSTCFSWVTRGFPPASVIALPPETTVKSVQWAAGITVKTQSKGQAQCPPKRWPISFVRGSEEMQQEGLLLSRRDCGSCWKLPHARNLTNVICSSPADSKDNLIACIVQAAATVVQKTGIFKPTHKSLIRRGRVCIEVSGRRFGHRSKLVTNTTFSEYYNVSLIFPNMVRPALMISGTARTHVRHRIAWL